MPIRTAVLLILVASGCATPAKVANLIVVGPARQLRTRSEGSPPNSPSKPGVLLLAIDGIERSLLYDLLRKGEMPAMAALLGGAQGGFSHAHFEENLLSTMPSSTLAAWTTTMTGVPPGQHGVTGNEFYIRETRRFAAPAPVSFSDSAPTLSVYTDGYLSTLTDTPTVYERLRAADPHALIWVAMHQLYSGADTLLVTKRSIMAKAFEQIAEDAVAKLSSANAKNARSAYEKLDSHIASVVVEQLASGAVPDVLTIYLMGSDLYAHIAEEGPDDARRTYLTQVVDPALAELTKALQKRGALEDRYVVVTSDHGHTQVAYDDVHALSTNAVDDPPAIVKGAGYRLRPFALEVPDTNDFNTVIAYGGAVAYVSLANRSTCPNAGDACDWAQAPRYEEDVLPMAEAFYKNNADGMLAPSMKGTLDLVLTRRPKPYFENDLPFEVYVGNGKTVPLGAYLKEHPHPTYEAFEERLRDLAVGPRGERAGDVMLLAHNGDRNTVEERYYFASRYRSWHGSPSHHDSQIPLIVAHPGHSAASLRAQVETVLGPEPRRQQKVTDLILNLRASPKLTSPPAQ